MKTAQLFAGLLICGVLTACGGGSSGSSSGALVVSPVSVSVAAGNTQQFSVTGSSGGTVTWEVNGIAGGNASIGTISSGGLYTAPVVPPISQPVNITATQSSMTGSAAATVTYSNSSLNGQFIFTFDELQSGGETNTVGIITADGNGNISGTEDVRSPMNYYPSQPVTGNYTLSANGQGTLTINGGGAGTLTLTFTLVGGAVQGVLTDATTGRMGGGALYPMTAAVSSASALNGNYIIDLGSAVVASNDNSVGLVSLSAPSINTGYMDENNGGAVTTFNSVNGNFAVGSGNQGTLSLTVGATTHNYVFYAVSPNKLELMCIDTNCVNTGEMNIQTSKTVASANFVFQLTGSGTGTSPDALLITGGMTDNGTGTGGSANFTIYENNNGFYTTISGTTTYTVSSYGRGTMTIPTPSGPRDFVFYVQSAGYLYLLETSSGYGDTSGFASATQSNAAAVSGQYLLITLGQIPFSTTVSTTQATLHVTSSGQVTGQGIQDNNGAISIIPVSGKLTASQLAGTYTMLLNLGGGQTVSYVMAAVAPGVLLPIGTDTNEVRTGGLYIQYTSP
ncbi:MAG TPA: hypothetical protein VNI53_02680 [Gammaproteobacteria bacterium]|nr:hypothetical protein [Gammaproteobacteria bacterium]